MRPSALVGYTNAGKSTLINKLTGAEVYADDRLFATLDPTVRQGGVARRGLVLFIDTVGFIRKLPHELVAAFRATLEEVTEADLLVHVVDLSSPDWYDQARAVHAVLQELDAAHKPMVTAFNKIDRVDPVEVAAAWPARPTRPRSPPARARDWTSCSRRSRGRCPRRSSAGRMQFLTASPCRLVGASVRTGAAGRYGGEFSKWKRSSGRASRRGSPLPASSARSRTAGAASDGTIKNGTRRGEEVG